MRVFDVPIMSAEMDDLDLLLRGSLLLLAGCAAPMKATRGTGDAVVAGSIGSSIRRLMGTGRGSWYRSQVKSSQVKTQSIHCHVVLL